jgi:hypothetical protein
LELEFPALRLPKLKLVGFAESVNVEATPVPLRGIVAGDPPALLVTVTLPLALPAAVGLKMMLNAMLCDGLRVTGTVAPLTEKPVPPAATCEICTFEFPVFVIVSICVEEEPAFTFPKFTLLALKETVWVVATPVPLSATTLGEPAALLMIAMLPLEEPAVTG